MPEVRAQAKSAPLGLQSKVLQNKLSRAKDSRTKEIEEWAREGRKKGGEFMRQGGQLTENVTEDLMLHEHLMEMSRARYKYISNNKYEKKIFLQRQMKKSAALREALRNVNLDVIVPKWATEDPRARGGQSGKAKRQTPARAPSRAEAVQTPVKTATPVPRPPLREKPESAPARRRTALPDPGPPRPQTRATGTTEDGSRPDSGLHSFFTTQPPDAAPKHTSTHLPQKPATAPAQSQPIQPTQSQPQQTTESTNPRVQFKDNTPPPRSMPNYVAMRSFGRQVSTRRQSMAKPVIAKWAKRNKAHAQDDRGPVRDTRYTKLASSLATVYHGSPTTPDVKAIVSMIGALNASGRVDAPKESRAYNVTRKIQEYVQQSGLITV